MADEEASSKGLLLLGDQGFVLPPFTRRLGLDGLRGFFVVLVLLFHFDISFFSQGYVGVDGFFVLSGFVITTILTREIYSQSKQIQFLHFYARRSKRLLPASLFVLITTVMAYKCLVSDHTMVSQRSSFLAGAAFWENFYLISNAKDYFAADGKQSPLMHYWSLAVEEQFYFLYPLFFAALARVTLRRLERMIFILLTCIFSLVIYQFWWVVGSVGQSRLYFGTLFRVYQLLSGALISLIQSYTISNTVHNRLMRQIDWKQVGNIFSIIGLSIILLLSTSLFPLQPAYIGALSTCSTILLISGLEITRFCFLEKLLSSHPLQFLGRHSYAIYLWHYPVIIIRSLLDVREYASEILLFIVIVVLSYLTWIWIENPVKKITLSDKKTLLISVCAILGTLLLVFVITRVPADFEVKEDKNVEWKQNSSVLASNKHTLYFIYGDSFAFEWYRALLVINQKRGISIQTRMRYGCPWVPGNFVGFAREETKSVIGSPILLYPENPDFFTECQEKLHDKHLPEIMKHKGPKVVFLMNFSLLNHYVQLDDGTRRYPCEDGWKSVVYEMMHSFIGSLLEVDPELRFVSLDPHPVLPTELANCDFIHGNVNECKFKEKEEHWPCSPELKTIYQALASTFHERFQLISMDSILCPDNYCRLIDDDGLRIWSDRKHMNPEWAVKNSEKLDALLSPFLEAPR